MTITHFQVQNIIKAYRVQSAVRSRNTGDKTVKNVNPKDEVILSPESKKNLLAHKITQGVMQQFQRGTDRSQVVQQALQQLSQEYGKPLALDAQGDFVVAWEGDVPGQNVRGIFAQRYDQAGNTLGSEFQVSTMT
ncbi:MAG: hypothetical protein NTY64_20240, partial [Deltaproteobacteria bacterium]|nr:hypothetical protein [Deltaproteobacteria bacterium]